MAAVSPKLEAVIQSIVIPITNLMQVLKTLADYVGEDSVSFSQIAYSTTTIITCMKSITLHCVVKVISWKWVNT